MKPHIRAGCVTGGNASSHASTRDSGICTTPSRSRASGLASHSLAWAASRLSCFASRAACSRSAGKPVRRH